MVDFFIHRPVFSTVCALLIILAGAVCIPTLPIAQFPSLAPPQVGVTAIYTGASSQTVESAVTTPLEQQINGAEGMKYVTSSSTNDGASQITATFDLSRNPDLASVDILKRVPGVAEVFIFGERKYSMRLWLDPVRLASRSLTAPDVVSALAEQNVEVAAGQVGSQPAIPGQQYQISVRAVGRLSEPTQFDNIILKTNADGTLVRLKDVGRAELGAEDYSSDLQYNGQDAI